MSFRSVLSVLALVAVSSAPAQAPMDSMLAVACPTGSGLVIHTDAGQRMEDDSARASVLPATPVPSAFDRGLPVDTTFTFAIAQRSWTRSYFAASLALGLGGEDGTTAATSRGPWRACVGAAVTMLRPTLTLRGVHGRVRLRADDGALRGVARGTTTGRSDSTARPRR